jgi:hypothetical protein
MGRTRKRWRVEVDKEMLPRQGNGPIPDEFWGASNGCNLNVLAARRGDIRVCALDMLSTGDSGSLLLVGALHKNKKRIYYT